MYFITIPIFMMAPDIDSKMKLYTLSESRTNILDKDTWKDSIYELSFDFGQGQADFVCQDTIKVDQIPLSYILMDIFRLISFNNVQVRENP